MQHLVFYKDIIILIFNRIIFFSLKLLQSLLIFSHYIAFFLLFFFINYNITHIMNDMILILEIVQTLFNIIRKLQTEIAELKISQTTISIFLQNNNMNLLLILKSEKFSDLFMFNDDQKQLHLFIIKLHLKLERNANQFSIDTDKI